MAFSCESNMLRKYTFICEPHEVKCTSSERVKSHFYLIARYRHSPKLRVRIQIDDTRMHVQFWQTTDPVIWYALLSYLTVESSHQIRLEFVFTPHIIRSILRNGALFGVRSRRRQQTTPTSALYRCCVDRCERFLIYKNKKIIVVKISYFSQKTSSGRSTVKG